MMPNFDIAGAQDRAHHFPYFPDLVAGPLDVFEKMQVLHLVEIVLDHAPVHLEDPGREGVGRRDRDHAGIDQVLGVGERQDHVVLVGEQDGHFVGFQFEIVAIKLGDIVDDRFERFIRMAVTGDHLEFFNQQVDVLHVDSRRNDNIFPRKKQGGIKFRAAASTSGKIPSREMMRRLPGNIFQFQVAGDDALGQRHPVADARVFPEHRSLHPRRRGDDHVFRQGVATAAPRRGPCIPNWPGNTIPECRYPARSRHRKRS